MPPDTNVSSDGVYFMGSSSQAKIWASEQVSQQQEFWVQYQYTKDGRTEFRYFVLLVHDKTAIKKIIGENLNNTDTSVRIQ
jgi:hypothetical protein